MNHRKSLAGAWLDLTLDSMALMQGSAVVIGKRTAAMAAAGPNSPAAHKREMRRMVEEKVSASAESWTRTAFAASSVYQSMAMAAMRVTVSVKMSGRNGASLMSMPSRVVIDTRLEITFSQPPSG